MIPDQKEIDWSKMSISNPNTQYKLHFPSPPNWNVYFGSKHSLCFMIYSVNPPNRFQRWMLKKFFGMTWENMESK